MVEAWVPDGASSLVAWKASFELASRSLPRRYSKTAEGLPSGTLAISSPPKEAKNPPSPIPSRLNFLTTVFLAFFFTNLSSRACSCASRRTLRSSNLRCAYSRAFWPFSADRCFSTSHSAHVRRASLGALSAVALPSSSLRHSRRAATSRF